MPLTTSAHRPHTAAQARLWNALNKGVDFWPVKQWPAWAQKELLKGPTRGRARTYDLFHFLTVNGLEPRTAGLYTLADDYTYELYRSNATPKRKNHVIEMINTVHGRYGEKRRAAFFNAKRALDMITGRVR